MTQANIPETPPAAPTSTEIDAAIMAKLAEVNATLPRAFQGIAGAYAPAVVRMIQSNGVADLEALYARLAGLTGPAALDQLHAHMTASELEAEKAQLTPLFQKMAQDSYDAQALAHQIVQAAIRAGIGLALAALTF